MTHKRLNSNKGRKLDFRSCEPVKLLSLSRGRRADHDVHEGWPVPDLQGHAEGCRDVTDRRAEMAFKAEHGHHPLVVDRRQQGCWRAEFEKDFKTKLFKSFAPIDGSVNVKLIGNRSEILTR